MEQEAKTIAQVVGENVKRLRGNKSMETVATAGRIYGLNWSAGSISAIEKGNFKVTLETLIALTSVLQNEDEFIEGAGRSWNVKQRISLHELLKTSSPIEPVEDTKTTEPALLAWLQGEPLEINAGNSLMRKLFGLTDPTPDSSPFKGLNLPKDFDISQSQSLTMPTTTGEERAAKSAGIHVYELIVWTEYLWGTKFEHKRDEEAGDGATPQKKGRITRNLVSQIQEAMKQHGKR
ncbi:MAG: helix-turn-helix transcriptional regulator [Alteromonadaceae bacterium]|nr:helix-turn-helix transcriptional regulator [Alteromonadaceae bacterium]